MQGCGLSWVHPHRLAPLQSLSSAHWKHPAQALSLPGLQNSIPASSVRRRPNQSAGTCLPQPLALGSSFPGRRSCC